MILLQEFIFTTSGWILTSVQKGLIALICSKLAGAEFQKVPPLITVCAKELLHHVCSFLLIYLLCQ